MFSLHTIESDFKTLQFVTVSDSDGFKTLNFHAKLIDDSPGNYLLSCDPDASLLITSLLEEELKVEQVSETATLEYLHLDARLEWILCFS